MARRKKEKKRGGGCLSTLILLIALGIFCFSGYRLIRIYLDYKVGTDEYGELEEYASSEKQTEGFVIELMAENEWMGEDEWGEATLEDGDRTAGLPLEKMENPIDFSSLLAINEDVIGWLEMEAIDISYPIVQGEDNDYYLHHTFRRQDNFAGSIFLDNLNRRNFSHRNSIIYGHNMKNGSMFGSLKKYQEQENFDKSPYFWIYTPSKIYKYEIFASSVVGTYSDSYKITFRNADEFRSFIDQAKAQSMIETNVDVDFSDTVVTLSTCTGDYSTRYIVQGKRVRTYQSVPKAGGYGIPDQAE